MRADDRAPSGLRGCGTALVTPFTRAGEVDEAALRRFVQWQLAEGVHFVVPCGSTGEAATLSATEHRRVVEIVVEEVAGRVPVVAGAGSNDTQRAIALSREMRAAGATHLLHVSPAYSKPPQRGIEAHFRAIADAVDLPIVLYNVPGRTVTDIQPATMARIVKAFPETFIGVKDATGQLARVSEQRVGCGAGFLQLSGNDETALAFNAMGGVGCISVTANVAPRLCADFQAAWAAGDRGRALELHDRLYPLHIAMFTDASPGPVKYAMTRVRPDFPIELRLPMTEPGEASRKAVDAALAHAGLI